MIKINKKSHLCKIRSMKGVRKEIKYSEPCSNARTVEFGLYPFEHSPAVLARALKGTTQTQQAFEHGWNNLFLNLIDLI